MGIDGVNTEDKLEDILNKIEFLESIGNQDRDEFIADEDNVNSMLKSIEVIAQRITDISGHIVIQNDWGSAESYGDSLDTLATRGVISQDLAKKIRSFIVMNYMIHQFPTGDHNSLLESIQPICDDIKRFVSNIRSYLEEIDY